MDLYLMQHGVAVAEQVDPLRPLTEAGAEQVRAVAARAAGAGVAIAAIWHSGKLRAEQTAHLLAAGLGSPPPQQRLGLTPGAMVAPIADWIISAHGGPGRPAQAIVGHLPFLDRFASLLVTADQSANVIAFHNAALVKLVSVSPAVVGGFAVEWILAPDLT